MRDWVRNDGLSPRSGLTPPGGFVLVLFFGGETSFCEGFGWKIAVLRDFCALILGWKKRAPEPYKSSRALGPFLIQKAEPMSLRLTPDILAAGYEFLRETKPFRGWRLPPSDEVAFHVVRDPKIHADFGIEKGEPVIRVSENGAGHTVTLLAALAHEMIHLRQYKMGARDTHGLTFRKMAHAVCREHGFDAKTF